MEPNLNRKPTIFSEGEDLMLEDKHGETFKLILDKMTIKDEDGMTYLYTRYKCEGQEEEPF